MKVECNAGQFDKMSEQLSENDQKYILAIQQALVFAQSTASEEREPQKEKKPTTKLHNNAPLMRGRKERQHE